MINELITSVLLIAGSLFMLIAALGIVRFPDIYTRMHAGTKAPALGIFLQLIAIIVYFANWTLPLKAVFIIFVIFLTTPLSTQLIGSAAHLLGSPTYDEEMRDDLKKETEKEQTS